MRKVALSCVGACVTLVLACSDVASVTDPTSDTAHLAVAVSLAGASEITAVHLHVSAPDLTDTLRTALTLENDQAVGTAVVPAGAGRTFVLRALDAEAVVRYEGSATVDVVAGTNPPLTIVMTPTQPVGEVPITGHIGGFVLAVSPTLDTILVGERVRLVPTVTDPWGNIVSDAAIAWMSLDPSVAMVDASGEVVGLSVGVADIRATYLDLQVTTSVHVIVASPPPPGPLPILGEPLYDAGNPDHVLHVYEDWSRHVTMADFGTAGRPDGGPPWRDAGIRKYGAVVDAPDPFGSVRHLTTQYITDPPIPPHGTGPHAAGYHWFGAGTTDPQGDDNAAGGGKNYRGFFLNADAYLNKPAKTAVVYEWAIRERGTEWYEGKQVDINTSNHGGVGRNLFNTYNATLGWNGEFDTPLVDLYYASEGVPRLPGLPPRWSSTAPNLSQIQSALTGVIGAPSVRYKQNRNWGTGPGQFSWGGPASGVFGTSDAPNADLLGQGTPMWEAGWLYYKLRITKQDPALIGTPGHGYGNGRIEMWMGKTPGSLLKVMEYLGDIGAFDEGLVFVDPTGTSDQLVNQIEFYGLPSRRFAGGAIVDFGTIRIWSHSRM